MRLLVVEDDPDLNRQLTAALTDAGYVVDRAFDGEEGHFYQESEEGKKFLSGMPCRSGPTNYCIQGSLTLAPEDGQQRSSIASLRR